MGEEAASKPARGEEFDINSITEFNDIPLNLFGIITTKVSDGKRVTAFMSRNRTVAYVLIEPVNEQFSVTRDEVMKIVSKSGVFMPDWSKDTIDEAVSKLHASGGEEGRTPVLFSRGEPKIDGEDSKVTWEVDITGAGEIDERPGKPKGLTKAKEVRVQVNSRDARSGSGGFVKSKVEVDDDGPIDHRAAKSLPQINKGDLICTVTQPTDGKDGKDVYDKPLRAKDGEWVLFDCGDGVEVNPERTEYRATESGFLRLSGKTISIRMQMTVDKVDFNTGNIDYRGRVEVKGDVGEGFSVKAGRELIIGGSGKDVQLQSGRRLAVDSLLGEKSFAHAGGDFSAKRIVNATVLVEGSALISQELVNANLHVAGPINATEANMVGGTIVGTGPIYLRGVGSPTEGGRQIIVIDPNYLKVGPVASLVSEIQEGKASIDKIRGGLGPLAENPSLVTKLPKEKRAAILRLLERLSDLTKEQVAKRDEYKRAVDILNKRIKPEIFMKRVFPGTTVKMLEAEKTFTEMSTEPMKLTLSRGGNEILVEPWLERDEVDLG